MRRTRPNRYTVTHHIVESVLSAHGVEDETSEFHIGPREHSAIEIIIRDIRAANVRLGIQAANVLAV